MTDFIRESRVNATARAHSCIGCGRSIDIGSTAVYFAYRHDGDFWYGYYHSDCREAEVALNHRNDTWGEDWTPLENIRDGEEAEDDCNWLAETFPTVAQRLGIVTKAEGV